MSLINRELEYVELDFIHQGIRFKPVIEQTPYVVELGKMNKRTIQKYLDYMIRLDELIITPDTQMRIVWPAGEPIDLELIAIFQQAAAL